MKHGRLLAGVFASLSLISTLNAGAVIPKPEVVQEFFDSVDSRVIGEIEEKILDACPYLTWGYKHDVSKEGYMAPFQCEVLSLDGIYYTGSSLTHEFCLSSGIDLLKICKFNNDKESVCTSDVFAFFHDGRYGADWFWVSGDEDLESVAKYVREIIPDGFTVHISGDGSQKELGALCSMLFERCLRLECNSIKSKLEKGLKKNVPMECVRELIDWLIMDKLERCTYITRKTYDPKNH